MDYQVSARKYRPGTFHTVIGQTHVVQTLQNAIEGNRIAHAFLFSGMRGVGKTTVARILAKALNCENGPTIQPCETCASCVEISRGHSVDVIEIDGASNTGVDDVRELRENVKFSPFRGAYRVYIIDEVHMLSNSAFNALLKTLEEPPSHAVFVFATTEVHKIPATILSRCQHFVFKGIPKLEIVSQLRHVVEENGFTIEDRSLAAIARASDGSMRDALSLLDQAVAFSGTSVTSQDLENLLGSVPDELVRNMVEAIIQQDSPTGITLVGQAFDQGYDMRIYCRELVERFRNLVVAAVVPSKEHVQSLIELPTEEVDTTVTQAKQVDESLLQEWFNIFFRTEDLIRTSSHPRFVLEVSVIRATQIQQNSQAPQPLPDITKTPATAAPTNLPLKAPTRSLPQGNRSPSDLPRSVSTPESVQKQVSNPPGPSKKETPKARLVEKKMAPSMKPSTAESSDLQTEVEKKRPPTTGPLNWDLVMDRLVNEHPNIGTFLEIGTLVKVADDQVIIGYPQKASVARSRIDQQETRALMTKVCEQVLGRSIRIQVIALEDSQAPSPTMGQLRAKQKHEKDQGLLEEVRAHPLVKQAIEIFGGEVVSAHKVPLKEEVT